MSHDFTNTRAMIVNKSFEHGIFPDQLKIAEVVPTHIKGSRADVGNYRLIFLLAQFSKIYENSRIVEY